MNITTNFQPGNFVWFIFNEKLYNLSINSITINILIENNNVPMVYYNFIVNKETISIHENFIFATRQELSESILINEIWMGEIKNE